MLQTIHGEADASLVSAALPHEHFFSDLRPLVAPLDNGIFYDKVQLNNYGALSRNPYAVLDNAVLDSENSVEDELNRIKKAGFNLAADVTTADFGRTAENILKLKELSEKTGVNIILGCGSYIEDAVSDAVKALSVEQMEKIIIKELTVGIEDTGIKAGVIGEIGSGFKVSENEAKFLTAAAHAQNITGFGMHIHACLWNRTGLDALDIAVRAGANPEKICIDHVDVMLDEEYILSIMEKGAYAEFDDFGKEYYVDRKNRNVLLHSFAYDAQRVQIIKKLIEKGFKNQILISNDVCLKSMLHSFGGWGYDHIGENIVPMMEDFGISNEDIIAIIRDNPIRFLERGN